jgi:hypothetical protein
MAKTGGYIYTKKDTIFLLFLPFNNKMLFDQSSTIEILHRNDNNCLLNIIQLLGWP